MPCSCGCNANASGCGQTQIGSPCSGRIRLRRIRLRVTRLARWPLLPVGELRGLIYRARRAPGDPARTYVHFFKEDRPVLATNLPGTRLYIVGGRYRVTGRGIEG